MNIIEQVFAYANQEQFEGAGFHTILKLRNGDTYIGGIWTPLGGIVRMDYYSRSGEPESYTETSKTIFINISDIVSAEIDW